MKIKLLTFNIQHCRNFITREIDVDGVVQTIKETGADIIGLNEVYGEYNYNLPQYQEIAQKLGFYYYFGQTFVYNNIPFGNALISRFKLKNPRTIMIQDPPIRDSHWYETRCIIHSNFVDFDLDIFVTHFGLFESEQENALEVSLEGINKVGPNIVFMGDLNMEADNEKIKALNNLLFNTLQHGLTYPSVNPTKKIDYIFISKNINLISAKIIKKVVSDHFPHYAYIELKK
ncbi:MAG: endonuclease/exonuclease/phosphatase family protein [Bacilli bacterium]|nr:endonuclease/exonuclease/phosphatase family protein [Bacilli bacterium]